LISPVFAALISLVFKTNFLASTLLFFGLPALYLSFKAKKAVKKAILFTLILLPLGVVFDFLGVTDHSWYVPRTVFPIRLLGTVPIEDVLWGMLLVYETILFYEYFLDKGKNNPLQKRSLGFIALSLVSFVIFLVLFCFSPRLFIFSSFNYFYFKAGTIILLVPTIVFFSFFPKLIFKFVITGVYFFALGFIFELTGLKLNQWTFPGKNFVGWVEILGYRFPFEEFFFWFVLFAAALLSYYEFFADDRK